MKNIAIIGSGSWGCALAIYLANNGNNVKIWSFSEEECSLINSERKCKFLKDAIIPQNVECFTNYKDVIENSDVILHVTPSKVFRSIVKEYKKYVLNQPIIICSKGFESSSLITLSDVLKEEIKNAKLGILSGPSHAEEVAVDMPTALVIASEYEDVNNLIINIFKSPTMRMYSSNDIKGVEIGGALKNILALCAGIIKGLGFGDNTFAALVTRGLVEISKLGVAMGGKKDTFYGLTGLGDLVLTCSSAHSRNRSAGILIGKGSTLKEAREKVGMVIEGIDNIEIAYKLSEKYKVETPIIDTVHSVLFNGLNARSAIDKLMTRDLKAE